MDYPSSDTPEASPRSGRGRLRLALTTAAVVAVLAAVFVGASFYTDQPGFCRSCHEMRPYHDAWAAGAHKDRWCVDCHSGGGYLGRMSHKFVALREVAIHFFGTPKFPLAAPPTIPDSRCSSCHGRVVIKKPPEFNHDRHADKGPCQACHESSGHNVSRAALSAAGVLGKENPPSSIFTTFAVVGGGEANVAGHVKVTCTRCHAMRETGCSRCHPLPVTKKHPKTPKSTACEQCHTAGPKWVFVHPTGALKCQSCHAAPTKHYEGGVRKIDECATCHRSPGSTWTFSHPAPSAQCQTCHQAPAKHYAGQCSSCHHRTGVSFAFRHPSTGAPHGIGGRACSKCHPTSYTKASCTCHDEGKVKDD